jgi:transposase
MAWTPLLGTASDVPKWKRYVRPLKPAGASTMNITTAGLDLAKNLFQVHGVDERGKAVLRKTLKRADVVSFFAKLRPCLIGMEACGSAHFWARKLTELGHTVRLMAPQFVKPYVKTNKNDARDAEGICEAVSRPNMRFVPIKNVEQQALLGLHRARQGFVVARTAQGNQIRGLLAEFGIVMPKGIRYVESQMQGILEDAENDLTGASRALFARLFEHFRALDRQVRELEREISAWHREDAASQRLQAIPGIGPLTASALVASIGDAKTFKNGRQLAAWLGLVPRQDSSGGKTKLLGISKRGDTYLRTLLIHGARSVLFSLKRNPDLAEGWLARLAARRNANIAAVALANKNARTVWALLAHGRDYQVGYRSVYARAAA